MDNNTSQATVTSLSGSTRLGDAGSVSSDGLTCIVTVNVLGYDQLLQHYKKFRDDSAGDNALTAQFMHTFETAKEKANISSGIYYREPGVGRFTVGGAEAADVLCETILAILAEDNRDIFNEQLRKNVAIAIVATPTSSLSDQKDDLDVLGGLFQNGDKLLTNAATGEIRISDAVYEALSAARRKNYSSVNIDSGSSQPAETRSWHRHINRTIPVVEIERCIMCIDMARFGEIERRLGVSSGDPTGASNLLRNQIVKIFVEGFKRAGMLDAFERSLYQLAGDSGLFIFASPVHAHKVGMEILRFAEERNQQARVENAELGMRCFRIGISCGAIGQDGTGGLSGQFLAQAKRLESGGPSGEIRMSEEAYKRLPKEMRKLYGDQELILGKPPEPRTPARRFEVTQRAIWEELDQDHKPWSKPAMPNRDPDFYKAQVAPKVEKCFVLYPMRPDPRTDEVLKNLIEPACGRASFEPFWATRVSGMRDQAITTNLDTAPMIIAYLGSPSPAWNSNVVLEVGYRLATQRPLVILSEPDPDGRTPDYRRHLPFQLVYHNVITLSPNLANDVPSLEAELLAIRKAKPRWEWDTPYPIIEVKILSPEEMLITDSNKAAAELFGEENVQTNCSVSELRNSLDLRVDPVQMQAVREDGRDLLMKLLHWAKFYRGEESSWKFPRARVPIIFRDIPEDPTTGKPHGFLPVVVRWSDEGDCVRVRYVYVRVSAAMHKQEPSGYYVCDL